MTTLPDKPSELIRVALADLRKVEAMPETYAVDMSIWHRPIGPLCFVCLAGSVMAMTLGESPTVGTIPWDKAHQPVAGKLDALNEFRIGCVRDGLVAFFGDDRYLPPDGLEYYVNTTPYVDDPEAFHRDMAKLADDLEAAGL